MSIAQYVTSPYHNPNIRKMVKDRDWVGIVEMWNGYYPDAHGIQKPSIPFAVRAAIQAAAEAAGVELPDAD